MNADDFFGLKDQFITKTSNMNNIVNFLKSNGFENIDDNIESDTNIIKGIIKIVYVETNNFEIYLYFDINDNIYNISVYYHSGYISTDCNIIDIDISDKFGDNNKSELSITMYNGINRVGVLSNTFNINK